MTQIITKHIDRTPATVFAAFLTDKGYQMIAMLDRTKHTVTVHNKDGTWAVCFDVPAPHGVGRVLTVAKLDRGAPQIRYVSSNYQTALTGPDKRSKMVQGAIDTARKNMQIAGWTLGEDVI